MFLVKMIRGFSVVLAGLTGKLAFAGFSASLTYAPATASVPTLSEWTLLALMALVAMISYRHLRVRLQGRPLAAVFLAGAAGVLAVSAGYVGEQAMAIPAPGSMTLPAGGTINLVCGSNGNVVNTTSITMAVTAVNRGTNVTTTGTCTSLPTMAPAASCSIAVQCPG
ncbi:MAG: midcut-by-XrtH protein [Curvibacter lanceolatus]|uniref:midcut-by-XrtH protein n=1 Tax=Curvibacter lanceolatus TaxID=86182 RepID=UPI000360A7FF|nr:midcut-by-XrtH protein [Curvibacter lanceolatus]MBV5291590.1 midcut-by-XrtH protein [Curvibacter lanceolatus]